MSDNLVLVISIIGSAVIIIYLWLPTYFSKQFKKEYGELNSDGEFKIISLRENAREMDHYISHFHSQRFMIRLYERGDLKQRNDSFYSSHQIDEKFPINGMEAYCVS